MPIYAYACKKCGHELDALQKISDEPLVECPECGAPELKRLLSAPRFRLKGSGWYETDFKTGDKRNLAGGDNDKPSSGGKAGDKKSGAATGDKAAKADKKPASKPASGDAA